MIKGIIFDADGTLLDSMSIWQTAGDDYLISLGLAPEDGLCDELRVMSMKESAEYLKEKYKINKSEAEIAEGLNSVIKDYYRDVAQLKEGVAAFLRRLFDMDIKMCIATATDRDHIEACLKRCGVDKYFCDIITCTEVGVGKESPEIYRRALELLNTEKSETVVFEDAFFAAETASNDGFVTVGVFDKYEKQPEALKNIVDLYLENYIENDKYFSFAKKL